MRKTLFICDSACDLSLEQEKKYGIKILNCGIEMNGMPYEDRVEITTEKIFAEVEKTGALPHTSQVNMIQFLEAFVKAARDGYTDIICVTMNSKGSGTYNAALQAKSVLPGEYPTLEGKLNIYVVDSTCYSYVVALPIISAIERVKAGENPEKIANDLQEWYNNSITLLGLYNLQYAKKSGRLNSCAAFVGDMLGLKPIMSISNGENKTFDKTRGDKNLVPKMAQLYAELAADIKGEYIIAYGDDPARAKELISEIKKLGGKAPAIMGPAGPCVAINAGPKMLGMGFRKKAD